MKKSKLRAVLGVGLVAIVALVVAACGSSNSSSSIERVGLGQLKQQQLRRQGAEGRGAAARHAVVGPLGAVRPSATSSRRSRPPASPHRSSTPRATRPPSSTQAEQAITNGAKVILLVEPRLRLAARRSSANAHSQGRQGHRLRPPHARRRRRLLRVVRQRAGRQAAGPGPGHCLKHDGTSKPVVAELNGSPTDNNATLFAQRLQLGARTRCTTTASSRRARTSPCPTGTTRRR